MTQTIPQPTAIWSCKIGVLGDASIPPGADAPMRKAVEDAFASVVGEPAEFCFSGWSAQLTEGELAVVENRLPALSPTEPTEEEVARAIWGTRLPKNDRLLPSDLEAARRVQQLYRSRRDGR